MNRAVLLFLLLSVSLVGCGKGNGSAFFIPGFTAENSLLGNALGSWLSGSWQDQSANSKFNLKLNAADNTFVQEVQYQVGTDGDATVPYPTLCHYRMSGAVRVDPASQDTKDHFRRNGRTVEPELSIQIYPMKYELIKDSSNSPACGAFIDRSSQQVGQGASDSLEIRKLSATSFVDAWYNINYQKL